MVGKARSALGGGYEVALGLREWWRDFAGWMEDTCGIGAWLFEILYCISCAKLSVWNTEIYLLMKVLCASRARAGISHWFGQRRLG